VCVCVCVHILYIHTHIQTHIYIFKQSPSSLSSPTNITCDVRKQSFASFLKSYLTTLQTEETASRDGEPLRICCISSRRQPTGGDPPHWGVGRVANNSSRYKRNTWPNVLKSIGPEKYPLERRKHMYMACGWGGGCMQRFGVGHLKERHQLYEPGVDGRLLRKWTWRSWLRIGTGGEMWTRRWTYGFHEICRISWLVEKPSDSQDGLFSKE